MDAGAHWAASTFGEAGLAIRARIPEMVRAEQEASADAQDASGHRSLSVFGQFWRGMLERFEEFGALPGVTFANPGRAPYRVPVINGVVLFPWRYGDGRQGPVNGVPFATSFAREALFKLGPLPVQDQFDFGVDLARPAPENAALAAAIMTAAIGDGGQRPKVVVVAIAASKVGVQDITWGEVQLSPDGHLEFLDGESLMAVTGSGPARVADSDRTFRAGEPPRKDLRVQGEADPSEIADSDA